MKGKGILIGADGDLEIDPVVVEKDEEKAGRKNFVISGLVLGNTTYQNQFVLLKAHKGELKEFPVLGVGLSDIVNDCDISGWSSEIKRQLEKDGMKVAQVVFDPDMNLRIDASYEV